MFLFYILIFHVSFTLNLMVLSNVKKDLNQNCFSHIGTMTTLAKNCSTLFCGNFPFTVIDGKFPWN